MDPQVRPPLPDPLVVVVGPTSSGKTGLSIGLARALGGEVVCADSVQVYRGMDIGSGKATAEERAAAPHHCLDLVDPDEHFDAAAYVAHADRAISGVAGRGARVILSGGTGLYIKALLRGLLPAPPVDPEVRGRLREEGARLGPEAMHRRLAEVDPALAARLAPRDLPRILRGLEVFETTGRPLSEHQAEHGFGRARYPYVMIGVRWERDVLRERIAARCHAMVDQGLVEEVRRLRSMGYGPGLRSMQSLGYKHMGWVVDGEMDLDRALELQIRDTRRYARRQMTWFRAEDVRWFDAPVQVEEVLEYLRSARPGRHG